MRARPASRLSLVPQPAPEEHFTEHLAPPHRATRRVPVPDPRLAPLLREALVSAGIGALKNSTEALQCLGLGMGAFVQGQLRLGGQRLTRSVARVARLVLDVPLSVGARVVSGVQTKLGMEPVGCRLGTRQLMELRRVFGDSIDYSRVCLKVGRLGLLSLPRRPFVVGHTLYVPARENPSATTDSVPRPVHLLVRELTRVWQYQHGRTDYLCQTLGRRWFAEGDDWRAVLDEGRGWAGLDPEQQARFLQAAYTRSSYFRVPGHRFIDEDSGVDYTPQLEAALEQLRAGLGAP